MSNTNTNTNTNTDAKTIWHNIDVSTLSPEQAKLYAILTDANDKAKEARKVFEAAFTKGYSAPAGYKLAISHRFGLSVAVVKADGKGSSTSKGSLADYLKAQAA